MKHTSTRSQLFANTVIGGVAVALALPAIAFAQDAAAPVQEVVVTGSRIPQPNLTATSPLTVVNNAEVKLEGIERTEDLLNNLPQVFASQGSTVSNAGTGTATVNLRGLGVSRTLVLVDGTRLEPGDPAAPVADLNNVPSALIQRVDVVTGGASAVYGADAVAGVVNIIMQHDFVGVRLDANVSGYEHDNDNTYLEGISKTFSAERAGYPTPTGSTTGGLSTDLTAVIGMNAPDGRGNIEMYAGYRSTQSILESAYDHSACSFTELAAGGFTCGGSGTSASGQFLPQNGPNGGTGDFTVDPKTGAFRPYSSATDAFNFTPYNYYLRPDQRYTAGAFAHYELTPQIEAYASFMFMDDITDALIAPSGLFGQTFNVPCSNPFLTAQELTALCGGSTTGTSVVNILRRNVEGGGRDNSLRHQDYRIVAGVRGDLNSAWHYDGYIQYGQSTLAEEYFRDFSLTNAQNALDVSGTAANPTCPANPVTGQACVPYNIFQPGGVTQAALNYIQTPGFENATLTEQVANITLNGKLGEYGVKSPWANDGVGIALGTEYRREGYNFQTDNEFSSGDLAGQGGPVIGTSGSYDVYELFAEVRAPLISDKPFVKDLSLDAGFRYSDYSTIGTTDTYKVEGNYSPTSDIRFRASYNHAVRAPNIVELFAPSSVGTGAFTSDPCAGPAVGGLVNGFTAAQCARTGVTAAQFGNISANSATQYNGLTGGNPNLGPEISDTYSGGLVVTPRFLPGFSASVDYFNIFVNNVISTLDPQQTIDNCVQSNILCNLVVRAPNTGSLYLGTQGYVVATNVNAGSLQTSGVDVQASYRLPIPWYSLGHVDFNLTGTYLESLTKENVPGSGSKYDCAGYYGPVCDGISAAPNPRWRHTFRATWTTPWRAQLSVAWRYIDSVKVDTLNSEIGGTVYPADAKLGSVNYIDLTANWKIKDGYTLRVGVNNVFDKDPPEVGAHECTTGPCNGSTYSQTYDALGRYLFAGITADF